MSSEPTIATSAFERLAAINVNAQVEKKGGLSYLSWAWAVDHLMRADPEAEWKYGDMLYLADRTVLIFCSVKCMGKWRTMQLPVMDHRNKPIVEPDAFQINTAMQRCLVKAIALHGLGLYIYAGEDLPPGDADPHADVPKTPEPRPNTAKQVAQDEFDPLTEAEKKYLADFATIIIDLVTAGNADAAHLRIEAEHLSIEHKMALWSLFDSKIRTPLQKAARPKAPPVRAVPALASQP